MPCALIGNAGGQAEGGNPRLANKKIAMRFKHGKPPEYSTIEMKFHGNNQQFSD
jgi:hypothetical protein